MKRSIHILKSLLLGMLLVSVSANAGAYSDDFFAIKIKTNNEGSSNHNQFTLPVNPEYTYNYHIICDDNDMGNTTHLNQTANTTCTYAEEGIYTVIISATEDKDGFPAIYFNGEGDRNKILEVVQWGTGKWKSMDHAFAETSNLIVTASDSPDLSEAEDMTYMFAGAENLIFSSSINDWDVSNITNMLGAFYYAKKFNQDIGDWNVSKVTNMAVMFRDARSFNQDIGKWDVSKVTNMNTIFRSAEAFNQNIGDWNVSKVTDTIGMFLHAKAFNGDIGNWNVSSSTSMYFMFSGADAFNQDIGDWDVSKVTNMELMFDSADAFNQDIGDWDVSKVTNMYLMLFNAKAFNQDISDWNPVAVTNPDNIILFSENDHLSISNYDNLLKKWSKLDLIDNATFYADTSNYCQGENARTLMESGTDDSWSFIDAGINCDFYITTTNEVSIKNGETSILNVTTNYEEDPYDPSVHYYITGGTDRDKFTMNAYGKLEFIVAHDANSPTDRNADNIYRVQVRADNLGYTSDYQTIKVKVVPKHYESIVPVIVYLLN